MPDQVDRLPVVLVNWLTAQLVEHETDPEKWWKSPFGFNYLGEPGEFPTPSGPPPGWERLPVEEPHGE